VVLVVGDFGAGESRGMGEEGEREEGDREEYREEEGEREEGSGEVGGRDTGEGGRSRCSCISVLESVIPIPSFVLSSVFSCCRVALSSCSCVFTACSLEFSSSIFCLSSFNCWIICSISSVWAFFLSLAVCAATLFFSFLLISLSSGVRWSRFALFLTGQSSSSFLISKGRIPSGEVEGAGLLLPTTAAMGFLFIIGCAIPSGAGVVLLMGVRAGGVEVRIVLLRVWGLEVITLYGEICLVVLGEILNKDFCWF